MKSHEPGRLTPGTANATEEFFVRHSPLYEVRMSLNISVGPECMSLRSSDNLACGALS